MDSPPKIAVVGFILRLEDDPKKRGYSAPKAPRRTALYLAKPETNEWDYEMNSAQVFGTIDQLLEAARNAHAQARIYPTEKLDILDTEGNRVRSVKQEELRGGTKPRFVRPVADEFLA